ncbi:transmembrane 7 superfamily member 3 isoform X2 [Phycodurus eques]|uniref:transmembrane 7 superfamily member 3 isoform X2 n=1 Tax=Phycodurus eques TaxID=693459 RepID=UPI002ACDD619|nr:transmembrane 7 superfamily member 3 isoform X2 [Phycodurus eques]
MFRWLYWLLMLRSILCEVQAQDENRVVFLPGAFQNISVTANETVQAVATGIPTEVAFATVQFHTQRHNVTLSYSTTPVFGLSSTAVDTGILLPLLPGQTSFTLFLLSADGSTVTGTGVTLPFSSTDPVPGGCNIEFNLNVDPNVYLRYNLFETTIQFAPANLGYERGSTPPSCDTSTGTDTRWRLQYDVYQYFLPENDLSERSLFRGVQAVADVEGMTENAKLIRTLSSTEMSTVMFSSIPGQGVIYAVIVRDPVLDTLASYVPVHTYGCSFTSKLDGCQTLGKITTKVFFTITGLAGLFICFFGHRFFKCELFCMGFSFSAFFFFVLITRTTGLDYDSDLDVFRRSNAVFWVTFCSIMIIFPIFFMRWPREGNITTCGVIGAYAVVLAMNTYIYTSLSYITLNILKRFLNNNFSAAFTDIPFQAIDYIMITVWVVLGAAGVVLQLYRERTRPFFPPSPYLMWLQERERRKTNVLDPSHHFPPLPNRLLARARQLTRRMEPAGEHTPLLL